MTQYRICKVCGREFSYPDKEEHFTHKGINYIRYPICKSCWKMDLRDNVIGGITQHETRKNLF